MPAAREIPGSEARRTVVILQPGYMPWLGFFDQLARADVFVYYDDVQYDKHGWRNRNRIKSPSGEAHWLTVPVHHHGRGNARMVDVEIDHHDRWSRKHVHTLRQFYARAPFVGRYMPELQELLERPWVRLADLNLALAALLSRWLGLAPRVLRSSEMEVPGSGSERLLAICHRLGAHRYLTGNAAQNYLDVDLFVRSGIEVMWQEYRHPIYPQLHGRFLSHLSVVDLLFNCGDRSTSILIGDGSGS